jgi:hypothetical protein
VRNKDGMLRLYIDFRRLNKASAKKKYPLPKIDDLFDHLRGEKIFSKIELRSGYHQVRINEGDISNTNFRTIYGHYKFVVMSFGLTNALVIFMCLMNGILINYMDKFVIVFLDDIFIPSWRRKVNNILMVLQVIRENKLYAKLSK